MLDLEKVELSIKQNSHFNGCEIVKYSKSMTVKTVDSFCLILYSNGTIITGEDSCFNHSDIKRLLFLMDELNRIVGGYTKVG